MRYRIAALMLAAGVALGLLSTPAAQGPTLAHGAETNAAACPAGRLVINVAHGVTNDEDSGTAGNSWASDDYVRTIQVWQTGETTFCAVTRYRGSFETVAGASPGNTDTIAAGITGTFQGGYVATVEGTLKAAPDFPEHGSIGDFDYSSGAFNWVDAYFEPGWTFGFDWWGWIYHAGLNGTWVNSSDGNAGDIID